MPAPPDPEAPPAGVFLVATAGGGLTLRGGGVLTLGRDPILAFPGFHVDRGSDTRFARS